MISGLDPAPQAIIDLCRAPQGRHTLAATREPLVDLDTPSAVAKAIDYLTGSAPEAALGNRGWTTYKVAARVRDFGVSQAVAVELISEHWNETRCDPPQEPDVVEQQAEGSIVDGVPYVEI